MQAHNSQSCNSCINCDRPLRPGVMKCLLSDMAVEMLNWMEVNLKKEVNEQSWLCENCFTTLEKTWSASQEPEVMDFSESTGLEQDPDPLSINRFLTEEIKIETEDEVNIEHYDYKVEIDTSQLVDLQEDSNEFNYEKKSDLEDDKECLEEQMLNDDDKECLEGKMLNDNDDDDYVSDKEDMSSEDEEAKTMMSEPLLLDGHLLRSGTKCDSCNTLLTKQPYRRLPDGPEKDYFVINNKRSRDVSPDRVCNPCYLKAHTAVLKTHPAVVKQSKKEDVNREDDGCSGSIVIPSYQRFARSSSSCIVHNCTGVERLRVPDYLRVFLLKFYNIYTPEQSRICLKHSKEYIRDWSFIKDHEYITKLSAEDVMEMLNLLREDALKHPD